MSELYSKLNSKYKIRYQHLPTSSKFVRSYRYQKSRDLKIPHRATSRNLDRRSSCSACCQRADSPGNRDGRAVSSGRGEDARLKFRERDCRAAGSLSKETRIVTRVVNYFTRVPQSPETPTFVWVYACAASASVETRRRTKADAVYVYQAEDQPWGTPRLACSRCRIPPSAVLDASAIKETKEATTTLALLLPRLLAILVDAPASSFASCTRAFFNASVAAHKLSPRMHACFSLLQERERERETTDK